MNSVKYVFCVKVILVSCWGHQACAMLQLFYVKSNDSVRSVIRANNEYARHFNIDRIQREYKLSEKETRKLYTAAVKMRHDDLVIPAYDHNKVRMVRMQKKKRAILELSRNVIYDVHNTNALLNPPITNKNNNAKPNVMVYSDKEATIKLLGEGKEKLNGITKQSRMYSLPAQFALVNSVLLQ